MILQLSLSWWKTLPNFGLNNPNPTVACNNIGNVSRHFRHPTQRGFWSLPERSSQTTCLVGQSAICGFVCLWNPKTPQGNATLVRTPYCLPRAQFSPSHCSGHRVFLIFADRSLAFKKLPCASPTAEFCCLPALQLLSYTGQHPNTTKLFSR